MKEILGINDIDDDMGLAQRALGETDLRSESLETEASDLPTNFLDRARLSFIRHPGLETLAVASLGVAVGGALSHHYKALARAA